MSSRMYQLLRDELNEIRLLHVLPGSGATPIAGRLEHHVSLDEAPEYQALSYTWGDPRDSLGRSQSSPYPAVTDDGLAEYTSFNDPRPKVIEVDSEPFEVTMNLESALRHLRHETEVLVLWVDAICINQRNLVERSSQVRKMGSIFQSASFVTVWLGPQFERSDLALNFIKEVSEHEKSNDGWMSKVISDKNHRIHFIALFHLYSRSYWRRLWVVQEAVLARDLRIHCGYNEVGLCHLEACQRVFKRHENELHDELESGTESTRLIWGPHDPILTLRRMLTLGRSRSATLPLESLLELARTRESADARDKVYGLIAISDAKEDLRLAADYTKSVQALYCDVVEHFIVKTKSLDIILLATNFRNPNWGLSLWIPDWDPGTTKSLRYKIRISEGYEAAGKTKTSEKTRIVNHITLQTEGLVLDTLSSVGIPCGHKGTMSEQHQHILRAFLDWRALMKSRHKGSHKMLSAFLNRLGPPRSFNKKSQKLEDSMFLRTIGCGNRTSPLDSADGGDRKISETCSIFLEYFHGFAPEAFLLHKALLTFDSLELPAIPIATRDKDWSAQYPPNFTQNMKLRRFLVSMKELVGLAPSEAELGDQICILFGCSVPVILRPRENYHLYIGDAYIDGYMYGRAMDELADGRHKQRIFDLR